MEKKLNKNSYYDFSKELIVIADDFYLAYNKCKKIEESYHDEFDRICYPMPNVPILVLGAFTCELYLKYLLGEEIKDHNLKTLFKKLNKKLQTNIEVQLIKKMVNYIYKDFESLLETIENCFTNFRYIFEDDKTYDGFNLSLIIFENLLPILYNIAHKKN